MKKNVVLLSLALAVVPLSIHAAGLVASDAATGDFLGSSVSQSGNIGLVAADGKSAGNNDRQGAAYVYRNLDTATGTQTEDLKLVASDRGEFSSFGTSVSLSGSIGLVGGEAAVVNTGGLGTAYVFRNLDTATGTQTESAKLTASDGNLFVRFGDSVSLSGSIGLVRSKDATGSTSGSGAAYVYRDLDTAIGAQTENVKLMVSDGAENDKFGLAVSQSGSIGLVGALGQNAFQGAAYIFRDLDAATGTQTENVVLKASDGGANDQFGSSVSQSGSSGLVGALGHNASRGAAYVYRNLDTVIGTQTEDLKLIASDAVSRDRFGSSVSESGSNGLVGAESAKVGINSQQGAAYVYRNLDVSREQGSSGAYHSSGVCRGIADIRSGGFHGCAWSFLLWLGHSVALRFSDPRTRTADGSLISHSASCHLANEKKAGAPTRMPRLQPLPPNFLQKLNQRSAPPSRTP